MCSVVCVVCSVVCSIYVQCRSLRLPIWQLGIVHYCVIIMWNLNYSRICITGLMTLNGYSPGTSGKTKGRHQTLRTKTSQKLSIPALGESLSLILSTTFVGENSKIAGIAESENLRDCFQAVKNFWPSHPSFVENVLENKKDQRLHFKGFKEPRKKFVEVGRLTVCIKFAHSTGFIAW